MIILTGIICMLTPAWPCLLRYGEITEESIARLMSELTLHQVVTMQGLMSSGTYLIMFGAMFSKD